MFADAIKLVSQFTKHLIIFQRDLNGDVTGRVGTFIILNKDGWCLTAAHLLKPIPDFAAKKEKADEYYRRRDAIAADPKLQPNVRQRRLGQLPKPADALTHQLYTWNFQVAPGFHVKADPFRDLALVQLQPEIAANIDTFPTFRNPELELQPGTSLCRFGFPFPEIDAKFHEAENRFELTDHSQIVPFPNEGIMTRNIRLTSPDGTLQGDYLETSSPGLPGQSGGPIFDRFGTICGLQSRTLHLPLGFALDPADSAKIHNKGIDAQFMNVGIGPNSKTIVPFLEKHKIMVNIAPVLRDVSGNKDGAAA
ncbi:MAG TPA: serine protease [Chloroflexia bacterium]|nr:serine protease [Chloroflexia bacterium]